MYVGEPRAHRCQSRNVGRVDLVGIRIARQILIGRRVTKSHVICKKDDNIWRRLSMDSPWRDEQERKTNEAGIRSDHNFGI